MIRVKRDSLENFMREQLIGPGGCGNNFGIFPLNNYPDEDESTDKKEKFTELCEVINTTPGSIYSSAILFPEREDSADDASDTTDGAAGDELDEGDDENSDTLKELYEYDAEEDINSLNRRFPNKIAVSCCLNGIEDIADTIITVSGRHYKKLKESDKLYVNIEDYERFCEIYKSDLCSNLFKNNFGHKDARLFLTNPITDTTELSSFRENLRQLNKDLCREAALNPDKSIDPVYADNNFKDKYKFLSAYKERLFNILKRIENDGKYLIPSEVEKHKKRIAIIEEFETFISYFEDLVAICDSRGFGYWYGEQFEKSVRLCDSNITVDSTRNKKTIHSIKDVITVEVDKDKTAALSIWLQIFNGDGGKAYLKAMLVNDSTKVKVDSKRYYSIVTESVNELSFFGIKIDIANKNICQYRDNHSYSSDDKEASELRYLYRSIEDYGIGHLCSVNWHKDTEGVIHVFSEFMPSVETPDVEPIPRDINKAFFNESTGCYLPAEILSDKKCLQFKWLSTLSEATNEEVLDGLNTFVNAYKSWIDSLDAKGNKIGEENISKCLTDYKRIHDNINEFLTDDTKMHIFRLMNTAMFMQLWHSRENNQEQVRNSMGGLCFEYYKNNALDTTIFKGTVAAWRPFQLAFILLNLDGVFQSATDPQWERRNELVDLVWFPTGGGKTESYLGIIALVILCRRLTYPGVTGNGVAAIMRYTLRLLATQQFQRALRLILALEQIRRWNRADCQLGNEEISIGLYVGKNSLPNTFEELGDEIRQKWHAEGSHGRIPLDRCPWCGSPLTKHEEQNRKNHFHFYCQNKKCTYGLRKYFPVRLCDEHIYEEPPTLLFGTVDKFARLAWSVNSTGRNGKSDSRRLFGKVAGCTPPDLIIQDELHLLLGPLGSAVSLFEASIDQLCSRTDNNGQLIRPKIISSTATTRNTGLQVRALYDRAVSIFPKSGIQYDDSFFSFYKCQKKNLTDKWSHTSKRKYIGIMPTGRTQMTTQMRLAAILFVHRALFELKHKSELQAYDKAYIQAADYYYSIISYFNSLKEVGKTDAQFYLEFTKYTRRLYKRVLRFSDMLECFYAYSESFSKTELTGRLSGGEAVSALSKVQSINWDPQKRLPYLSDAVNKTYAPALLPFDYILATNMISVGLDVSRFNTIIMNSMPRNIAEYIQASSRVARDRDGLVVTLHNPFRSRDVSHFEKFIEFHEKLYYFVEPISITPFSPKAIEKYLPLYIITFIRHNYGELANRTDACKMNDMLASEIKDRLKEHFNKRYERTKNLVNLEKEILTKEQLKFIYQWIDDSLDQWLQLVRTHGESLVYYAAGRNENKEVSLLVTPEDYYELKKNSKWIVPSALRIVDPESVLHIN